MPFSETVLAAMIGAIATVSTALFQLVTAIRSRNKLEVRPKKGRTFRSIVAIIALVAASGVGGYLYAGMRHQSASDDLRSMREELNAKLQLLAVTTERLAQSRDGALQPQSIAAHLPATNADHVEAVLYVPACQAAAACTETAAQKTKLCGSIPSAMQMRKVEVFAKSSSSAQTPWEQAALSFEQDAGGAKFTGAAAEYPQDENHKAVCVDFLHWSAEAHLARLLVHYGAEQQAVQSEATAVATTAAGGATQSVSLAAPALVQ